MHRLRLRRLVRYPKDLSWSTKAAATLSRQCLHHGQASKKAGLKAGRRKGALPDPRNFRMRQRRHARDLVEAGTAHPVIPIRLQDGPGHAVTGAADNGAG